VEAGMRAWSDRLASLTAAERARIGLHPRLGEVPVDRMLERFVLGHAEDHVAQLEEILGRSTG
jgi:hypothetical protein